MHDTVCWQLVVGGHIFERPTCRALSTQTPTPLDRKILQVARKSRNFSLTGKVLDLTLS